MVDLEQYFTRIGYDGPRSATRATLRGLQAAHPLVIPFENLDTLAGRPVRLDPESLERKLVQSRRGGYCFEQNLLFKHVLTALGFAPVALSARVEWQRPPGAVGPRTHMVLLVGVEGRRYVCDVGFGGLTPTAPIELVPDVLQQTPHETFRVREAGAEFAVEALVKGEWKRLYRFDLQPQEQIDIELLNHYVMTHDESPMRGRLIAARVAADRRFGLGNGVLNVHPLGAADEQRRIETVAELRRVLAGTFGVDAPAEPTLEAVLAGILAVE